MVYKSTGVGKCDLPKNLKLMQVYDEEKYNKELARILPKHINTVYKFVYYYKTFGDQMTTKQKEKTLSIAALPLDDNKECMCSDDWEPILAELLEYTNVYIMEREQEEDHDH